MYFVFYREPKGVAFLALQNISFIYFYRQPKGVAYLVLQDIVFH